MSPMIPLLLSAWWADMDRPSRLMDHSLGTGLYPNPILLSDLADIYTPIPSRAAIEYYRQLADRMRYGDVGSSSNTNKDEFKVMLDVQQFKPEEISVKLIDNFVVVEAKHEEKKDQHGYISRHFSRRYLLPYQADGDQLSSTISSDGVLTITAPFKPTEEKSNERTIKIEQTGKPAIRFDTPKPKTPESTTTSTDNPTTQESNSVEETTESLTKETPEK
ncbi:protein lethal(2)essential for life-like [Hylaeus volcanicus]|uniref:protein lethal(2)essential for life-like n=1 Tax=Hylaeus volcanicus TaxID=313075 RepID=UPI0023B7AED4|nr:protein lethal(2)essential for life-like [Hylaeus volcanicus]